MPDHPLALALIREAGVPIAAPSANRSGRPSPTTAGHVHADLNGRIAGILDGGSTGVGVESTVLDVTVEPAMILRPGGVTAGRNGGCHRATCSWIPAFLVGAAETPRSPGMKYTHYAPEGEMWLVAGEDDAVRKKIRELLADARQHGRKRAYWQRKRQRRIGGASRSRRGFLLWLAVRSGQCGAAVVRRAEAV